MKRRQPRAADAIRRRTTLTLPADSLAQAERLARARRVNLSVVVSEALDRLSRCLGHSDHLVVPGLVRQQRGELPPAALREYIVPAELGELQFHEELVDRCIDQEGADCVEPVRGDADLDPDRSGGHEAGADVPRLVTQLRRVPFLVGAQRGLRAQHPTDRPDKRVAEQLTPQPTAIQGRRQR